MKTKQIQHVGDLTPDKRNARKHTPRNVGAIVSALHEVGAARSIVIDEDGVVLAGNATIEAAAEAGITKVQVVDADGETVVAVRRSGLTPEQKTRLALFDNRAAELADWDTDVLRQLADEGALAGMFEADELAALLEADQEPAGGLTDPDAVPDERATDIKLGDLFNLGKHLLLCGDSTKADDVARVMDGERAAVCLTDPPYGLGDGKASGKNNYAGYEDSHFNLVKLAKAWLPLARQTASACVFSPGVTNAWIYPPADWVMCWFYGGGQLRSSWGFNYWQPFLCYGKDPSLATGNGGRPDAVDMNTPANAGDIDHPCPKPIKLWEWFIQRLSFSQDDVFYEPFSGSGTTLIACEQLGRVCHAIEIEPRYVQVAIDRWEQFTGQKAVRVG